MQMTKKNQTHSDTQGWRRDKTVKGEKQTHKNTNTATQTQNTGQHKLRQIGMERKTKGYRRRNKHTYTLTNTHKTQEQPNKVRHIKLTNTIKHTATERKDKMAQRKKNTNTHSHAKLKTKAKTHSDTPPRGEIQDTERENTHLTPKITEPHKVRQSHLD